MKKSKTAPFPDTPDRLLTIEEAATLLGRTQPAVYRLVALRRLPFRKDGRRVFFKERELQAFIDALPGISVAEALDNEQRLR